MLLELCCAPMMPVKLNSLLFLVHCSILQLGFLFVQLWKHRFFQFFRYFFMFSNFQLLNNSLIDLLEKAF